MLEPYCRAHQQSTKNALVLLKIEFLRYFLRLSSQDAIRRAQVDLLIRWFLQVPIEYQMPHHFTLIRFQGCLGAEAFKRIYDRFIGLVKDLKLVRARPRREAPIAYMSVESIQRWCAQLDEIFPDVAEDEIDVEQDADELESPPKHGGS